MSVVERLSEAADLVRTHPKAGALDRAVAEWLRAEVLTQKAMEPLVDLVGIAIKTASGREAGLSIGRREDGEFKMQSDTNEHALAVAELLIARYGGAE